MASRLLQGVERATHVLRLSAHEDAYVCWNHCATFNVSSRRNRLPSSNPPGTATVKRPIRTSKPCGTATGGVTSTNRGAGWCSAVSRFPPTARFLSWYAHCCRELALIPSSAANSFAVRPLSFQRSTRFAHSSRPTVTRRSFTPRGLPDGCRCGQERDPSNGYFDPKKLPFLGSGFRRVPTAVGWPTPSLAGLARCNEPRSGECTTEP